MSEGVRVLVVEDEADSAQVLSTILNHNGIDVHIAHDGHECIEMLGQVQPNVVVMDLNLPSLDGWSTLVEMRTNTATAHIPVIAITAYHSANVAQDAMQAGFDAYFAKPVDSEALVRQVMEVRV